MGSSSTTFPKVPAWLSTDATLPFLGLILVCLLPVPLHTQRPEVQDDRLPFDLLAVVSIVEPGSADLTLYSEAPPAGDEGMIGMVLTDGAGDLARRSEGPGDVDRIDGACSTICVRSVLSVVARASDKPSCIDTLGEVSSNLEHHSERLLVLETTHLIRPAVSLPPDTSSFLQ